MKRRVGRPRTRIDGQTLTVFLPNESKARLSKLAFDHDASMGEMITMMVNEKAKDESRNSIPRSTINS